MKKILVLGQYQKAAMYHPLDKVDNELSRILEGYELKFTDSPQSLLKLDETDIVISYWDDWNKAIDEECVESLVGFVKAGKGLLVIHNGISLALSDKLKEVIGASFITHPQQTEIKFMSKDGVSFSMVEEPYQFDMIDDGKEVFTVYEYKALKYPACFRKYYGKGKVAYLQPGHTFEKFRQPQFEELIKESISWLE